MAEAAPATARPDLAGERRRSIAQAIDEGHDADIPSSTGYVPDQTTERRRSSLARQRSRASDVDPEKGAAAAGPQAPPAATKDDDDEAETSEDEANIVWWDGDDDPDNPYNWPTWRKVVNCTMISLLTFITPLGSSMFAPGVPQLMADFQNSSVELAAFVVSVYVLGFALGPMLLAPLSEIYGRLPIYHVCNFGYLAFSVACAEAPTLGALIAFRFLAGVFGSAPLTNGGGSIADMIHQEHRAAAMSVFSLGPLLGPTVGPITGGFLAQAKGWRWVFWLLAIISGFITATMLLFAKESYAPIILQRKVAKLRKETGNGQLRSKLDAGLSPRDYFARGIVRPIRMLLFSPIVIIFAIYMAVIYGYLYLLYTSMTYVFEATYGFSTGLVGLAFLGIGIGCLIGLGWYSVSSDRYTKKMAALEGQGMKPEYRLQPLPYGAIILPVGFFIYGWTAQYQIHWIVPIIGTLFIGIGNLLCFMAIAMYLVDAFNMYAASALAANTVVRSIVGAVLPLAGLRMYEALGLGWGNSLLGFVAIALVPVPFLVIRWGEYLRKKFELKDL